MQETCREARNAVTGAFNIHNKGVILNQVLVSFAGHGLWWRRPDEIMETKDGGSG